VGVFARSIKDIALITDQLTGYDINDSATAAVPKPHLSSGYLQDAPGEPRFAFVSAPYDDRLAQDTRAGFAQLQKTLKAYAEPIDLPDGYGNMIDHHRVIHDIEIHQLLSADLVAHPQLMSPQITGALQRAAEHSQEDYAQAIDIIDAVDTFFCELFNEFDAIIAPSAAGEAPATLKQTGDPIFCTLWTLAGLPALTMPLLKGSTQLPIGVQLIAGAEQDARLMRTARWLCNLLEK
jgi:Asp-tRNA(Asn)/Glu-tRNA(Gln) amidotransferase A subunit family amidase